MHRDESHHNILALDMKETDPGKIRNKYKKSEMTLLRETVE